MKNKKLCIHVYIYIYIYIYKQLAVRVLKKMQLVLCNPVHSAGWLEGQWWKQPPVIITWWGEWRDTNRMNRQIFQRQMNLQLRSTVISSKHLAKYCRDQKMFDQCYSVSLCVWEKLRQCYEFKLILSISLFHYVRLSIVPIYNIYIYIYI